MLWRATYLGGDTIESTQCMAAGSNDWHALHAAYAGGQGNNWTAADGAASLAHFTREDVPTRFDIVEGWTILDMNHQSVLAPTDPIRIRWSSGTINSPGSPSNRDGKGSIIIDNNATSGKGLSTYGFPMQALTALTGCEAPNLYCYSSTGKNFPEYLQEVGITWQLWLDLDNFEDNPLAYFEQYRNAPNGSALRTRGNRLNS